jgi:hypothetical protein
LSVLGAAAVFGTAIATIVGAWLAMRRAPYERDGVYISTAEGATRILNSAMLALEKDNERKALIIEQLMTDAEAKTSALHRKDEIIDEKQARIRTLEAQLAAPPEPTP